jgi:hypothetical protein
MMNKWFEAAQKNLSAIKSVHCNEANTRRLIIEPILAAIGYEVWDASSPCRVDAEPFIEGASQQGGKGKADYILFSSSAPLFAVEAKSIGTPLSDADAKQLCDYCLYKAPPIKWGVLTNGSDWRLYDTDTAGSPEHKKVMQWNLAHDLGALVVLLGPGEAKELKELTAVLSGVASEKYRIALLTSSAAECKVRLSDTIDPPASAHLNLGEANVSKSLGHPLLPDLGPDDVLLDPNHLADLAFTSILEGSIDQKNASDWNSLVRIGVKIAYSHGLQVDQIIAITGLNLKPGSHADGGFKPVDGCSLSVQNVDVNHAAHALIAVAKKTGVPLLVRFRWQDKSKAAHPGKTGILQVA